LRIRIEAKSSYRTTLTGADDILVTVGGTIPQQDIAELKSLGVAGAFTPGAPVDGIVRLLETKTASPKRAGSL
jgi:methylmalonyl-CoA mutase C-terminal domain/subunit